MPGSLPGFLVGLLLLLHAGLLHAAELSPGMACHEPCAAFDRFDKLVRDGRISREAAQQKFPVLLAAVDHCLAGSGSRRPAFQDWIFPLRGYRPQQANPDPGEGYVATGYDYFDGNRHGGHPSYDLFIRDRDRDSLDDATGKPVEVLSMSRGVVVAVETEWRGESELRGGKYLWIYDPDSRGLAYYAHNREILVRAGDPVVPGTPVATVGRSGLNAARHRSPTHLHLTWLSTASGRPLPLDIHPRLITLPVRQ